MNKKLVYNETGKRFTDNRIRVSTIKVFFFRLPVVVAVLFLLFYPFNYVFAHELSEDEQAYLRSKGTIVFVSQTRYPPFEFTYQNGEHTGMCIELARWMATEFGFTAKFTDTYFKQAQQDILSNKADVLTSFFYSKKRDESFDFTQLMFEVPASIFVVAERTDIKDIQDLNGKRIAMQAGDYAKEFLELKGIKFDIVYSKNFAEATDLVIAGKADAILGDEQIVLYHIFQDNLTDKIKKVGDPLYIGQNCMATKEGNQMLISILDKGIKLAQTGGILEKINRKWIGTHYTPRESLLFKYLPHLYIAVGTIFVLALLSYTWNIRLRQAVREQTARLQKSEEKYRELAEFLPQPVFEIDINGNFVYSNRCGFNTFGYTLDDFKKGVKASQLFIPKDRERVQKNIQKKLSGEDFEDHEYTGLRKDGSTFPMLIYSAPIIHNGKAVGVRGIVVDISERKRAEEKLQKSEMFLNAIVENIPDMIFVKDAEQLQFVRFNKAGENLLGYNREELIGRNDYDIFPKVEADFFTEKDREVLERGTLLDIAEESLHTKYKGKRILHTKKIPLLDEKGQPEFLLGISEDITERKLAEELLRKSEELLRATIESTADGILVVDEKGIVTHTNRRFAQMWQIPDELIKTRQDKKLLDFVLDQLKEPEAFLSKVQALYKTSDEDFDVLDFKDGRVFERFSCPLIRDNQIVGRVWSFRDITDRKRAESALIESEIKYRGIFNESIATIYVFDTEKNFLDSNQAGLDLLGYSREELLKMSIPDVDADPTVILSAHKQLLGGERIINYEHQLERKDGKIITVLNNSRPFTDAQGNVIGMQSTLIDITERKHAEKQIMASLKEKEILLREIHHRIKNNLAVISSLLSMQANIVTNQDVRSALQKSQSRVKAMALIHETLYQSESLALVDLEKYVKDLISNIVNAFNGIAGRINFDIKVSDVKLEINQAIPCGLIINELATNALKHAFSDEQHGVVRIIARYTEKSEVKITVSDNGIGFSDELDWKNSKSLGLRLISLMVDQLHGIMNIRNHHGAEISIKWPVQVT